MSIRNDICGTWHLLGCKLFDENGKEVEDPFHNASGVLIYDAIGNMSVQIMQQQHQSMLSESVFRASIDELKQSFKNYIAYFGKYMVNEKDNIITHCVEGALWPNMIETQMQRRFKLLDNNTLILSTLSYETNASENPIMRHLTWSRDILI